MAAQTPVPVPVHSALNRNLKRGSECRFVPPACVLISRASRALAASVRTPASPSASLTTRLRSFRVLNKTPRGENTEPEGVLEFQRRVLPATPGFEYLGQCRRSCRSEELASPFSV